MIQKYALLVLASTLLAFPGQADALERIPLYRRGSLSTPKIQELTVDDGSLVGIIEVGTPPVKYPVLLDTASSLSWIPSTKCHSSECRAYTKAPYDPEKSSSSYSLHKKDSFKFDNGSCVDVEYYTETITLAGLTVENQLFGAAYSVKNIGDEHYIGYLGLGGYEENRSTNFTSGSGKSGHHKRVYNNPFGVAENGLQTMFGGDQQQFSIVTDNGGDFQQIKRWNKPHGELILGGVDHDVYSGCIAYFPIPTCDYGNSPYWKAHVSSVMLGHLANIPLCHDSLASFTTSSKYITGPKHTVELLHHAIGADYNAESDKYLVKCCDTENLPDLSFGFDHYKVSIHRNSWIKTVSEDGEWCEALIRPNSNKKEWGLGNAFLNNFYHIYDISNKRTGLAIPKGSKAKAKITKTGSRATHH